MNGPQIQPRRTQCHMVSLAIILMSLTLSARNTRAFTRLPTCARMSASHSLWGQGHIQRVGPSDDSDIVPASDEVEEKTQAEVKIPLMSLDELLLPSPDCDVNQVGPTALAYIGDVVFELLVRSRHVWPTRRTADLQQQVVAFVRAEHQAKLLALLYKMSFPLSKKEQQILARGRNSASATRSRRNAAVYQDATALEALVGYLYISDRRRCEELLNWIYAHLDRVDYDGS